MWLLITDLIVSFLFFLVSGIVNTFGLDISPMWSTFQRRNWWNTSEEDFNLTIQTPAHIYTLCRKHFCDCHRICLLSISSHRINATTTSDPCYVGNVEIVHHRLPTDAFYILKFLKFVFLQICIKEVCKHYLKIIVHYYLWILYLNIW